MSRIRSIKPGFFRSPDIAALSYSARLTFIGLWCYVDDWGKGPDDARLVWAEIWPLDARHTVRKVEADLAALAAQGLILRYEAEGRRWLKVAKWAHQKVSHPRPSTIPDPPEDFGTESRTVRESRRKPSGTIPEGFRTNSRLIGKGNRKSSSSTSDLQPATTSEDDDDDQGFLELCAFLAEADLARRQLEAGPVGHADSWLRAAKARRAAQLRDWFDALTASERAQTVEELATMADGNFAPPPPKDPLEAQSKAARRIAEANEAARAGTPEELPEDGKARAAALRGSLVKKA